MIVYAAYGKKIKALGKVGESMTFRKGGIQYSAVLPSYPKAENMKRWRLRSLQRCD